MLLISAAYRRLAEKERNMNKRKSFSIKWNLVKPLLRKVNEKMLHLHVFPTDAEIQYRYLSFRVAIIAEEHSDEASFFVLCPVTHMPVKRLLRLNKRDAL